MAKIKEILTDKEKRLMRRAWLAGRQSVREEMSNPYFQATNFSSFNKWLRSIYQPIFKS